MKATGIIRRIDDLGRVVIPREIRRIMRIREGDPLEIFIEDGGVVFKKYNPCISVKNALDYLKDIVRDEDDLKCKNDLLKILSDFDSTLKQEQETIDKNE